LSWTSEAIKPETKTNDMKSSNLIETDSARIREINATTARLGIPARLISIETILHRAGYADQQSDFIGEVHTVETNGVRKQVPIWFRGNRVSYVG